MPWLNWVFEELGVKYGDHEVPEKLWRITATKVDSSKAKANNRKVVSQHFSQKKAKVLGGGTSS